MIDVDVLDAPTRTPTPAAQSAQELAPWPC